MAVVPSLAAMAALTLFQNPHTQPEGYSVDYSDYSAPATVIQRSWRRRGVLHRAATRINALLRAFYVRCYIVGIDARINPRRTYQLRPFGERVGLVAAQRLGRGRRYWGDPTRINTVTSILAYGRELQRWRTLNLSPATRRRLDA